MILGVSAVTSGTGVATGDASFSASWSLSTPLAAL